jgi:NADPH:quinone reductase
VGNDVAASLPTDGLAALAALEALRSSRGATLLIVGATGAIGALALQLASKQGANVIAAVRRSAGDAWALGASAVIVTLDVDLLEGVRATEPGGVDGVLDLVGADTSDSMRLLTVIRSGGVLVSANCVADVDASARQGISAINLTRHRTMSDARTRLKRLMALAASGQLVVTIARELPLFEAADALKQGLAGQLPGKTLFRIGRSG